MKPAILATLGTLLLVACKPSLNQSEMPAIEVESYGKLRDGREANIFTLTNEDGLEARITEYGAHLVSMRVPDKAGRFADVTLGYDTLDGWLSNTSYFGATVLLGICFWA